MPVFLPQRRLLQPQHQTEADTGNPLIGGQLGALFVGAPGAWDGKKWAKSGQESWLVLPGGTASGPTMGLPASALQVDSTHYYSQAKAVPPNAPGWALAGLIAYTGTPSDGASVMGFCNGVGSGTYDRQIKFRSSPARWDGYLFDGAQKDVRATTVISPNTLYNVVLTATPSLMSIYVNGVLENTLSVGTSGYTGYTTPTFAVGNSSGLVCASYVALGLFVNFPWSAGHVASFARNPWQILRPRTSRIYVGAAAAASVALLGQACL